MEQKCANIFGIYYNSGLKIEPDNYIELDLRGKLHLQNGNIDKAINDFSKAIEIKPDDPEILKNRAKVYCQKGNINEAIIDLSRVIELKPDDAEALGILDIAYKKRRTK